MGKNYQSLNQLEADIRRHTSAVTEATDETSAARSFRALQAAQEAYLAKAKEINRERWKTRETVLKQAKQIGEFELTELTGAGERTDEQHFHVRQPDVLTVQQSPDFYFIRLSFGLLNIRSIDLLHVKSKTLHLNSGTINLSAADTRILVAQMKLYPAPKITTSVPINSTEVKANTK